MCKYALPVSREKSKSRRGNSWPKYIFAGSIFFLFHLSPKNFLRGYFAIRGTRDYEFRLTNCSKTGVNTGHFVSEYQGIEEITINNAEVVQDMLS